jgi:hypothetical protein
MSRGLPWAEKTIVPECVSAEERALRDALSAWLAIDATRPLTLGCWNLLSADEREEIRLVVRSAKRLLSWR